MIFRLKKVLSGVLGWDLDLENLGYFPEEGGGKDVCTKMILNRKYFTISTIKNATLSLLSRVQFLC